jgi:hypothetical protein
MDLQPDNPPDLRMPPPSVEPGVPGSIGAPESASPGVVSDAPDTVLVSPNGNSPKLPITDIGSPAAGASTQDDSQAPPTSDDDNDSLDEEWIQKAKLIVDQTRADPYQQSKEISRVKANFLKTHYNKDIKVAEDQSL